MERMEEDQMIKLIESDVRGVNLRAGPKLGWMDGVKKALNERDMSMEERGMIVRDRSE